MLSAHAPDHISAAKNSSRSPSIANHGTVRSDDRPSAPSVSVSPFSNVFCCSVNAASLRTRRRRCPADRSPSEPEPGGTEIWSAFRSDSSRALSAGVNVVHASKAGEPLTIA